MRDDWHKAEIKAALQKKGTSLAILSRNAGLSSTTMANALARPWPKGEYMIANALAIHPAEIWPSRYFDSDNKLIDRYALIRRKRTCDV